MNSELFTCLCKWNKWNNNQRHGQNGGFFYVFVYDVVTLGSTEM